MLCYLKESLTDHRDPQHCECGADVYRATNASVCTWCHGLVHENSFEAQDFIAAGTNQESDVDEDEEDDEDPSAADVALYAGSEVIYATNKDGSVSAYLHGRRYRGAQLGRGLVENYTFRRVGEQALGIPLPCTCRA